MSDNCKMNSSKPAVSSRRFAGELIFAWSTLTAGAVLFAILATLLSAMDFPETVRFLVPLLVTLVLVVALHLNRLAGQWPEVGRGSTIERILGGFVVSSAEPRREEEFVELLVKFYRASPPERRSFEAIVEDVARELGTRNDKERVKAELERTRETIQRLLETLG